MWVLGSGPSLLLAQHALSCALGLQAWCTGVFSTGVTWGYAYGLGKKGGVQGPPTGTRYLSLYPVPRETGTGSPEHILFSS